jgi:hypothetical protein
MSSPVMQAISLCDTVLALIAQKKVLAEDKRRVDDALSRAEADLMAIMFDNNMTVVGSDRAVATLDTTSQPKVTDWGALYEHITQTGSFDLLYRRVSATAVEERSKVGATIPGVEVVPVTSVKVKPKRM